ncbi:MAG TPA: CBS domain-containing protein [Nocardioides sp.]|jgi:CBS-domain-containing membrane protein|nr:CBS domain-containing protein [Nocardioides sp.]
MLVKDVMTRDPVTVVPSVGIKAAMTKLAFVGITSMPVVDEEQHLCGILSEADLIRDVADDPRAHERPITIRPVSPPHTVDDVYTRSPIAIGPQDDVTTAVDVMTAKGFKSLPVVDHEHRLVGMVSRSDVLRALARDDDVIALDVVRLFQDLGHAGWTVDVDSGVVEVTGPEDAAQRSLAHALSRTVAGVVAVHVRQ